MVPHSQLSDLRACFERRTAAQSQKAYNRFNEMNHYGTMTRAGEELRSYGLRAIKVSFHILKTHILILLIELILGATIFGPSPKFIV